MSTVGQIERICQNRIVKLFQEQLGYRYLGNWEYRDHNRNIETETLSHWLRQRGVSDILINKALRELDQAAALSEGQNLSFFTTMQLVMAGNDTQGLRYGTIETPQKYYLQWKEASDNPLDSPLDDHLSLLCNKTRFLELIHDFIVFDGGIKKTCRHNQYFGIRAAQQYIHRREGGIIWHTQGSGKSLVMVWLAKWIRENVTDSRVLIITDRTELDDQIEKVFLGVEENIYRTTSGADLISTLDQSRPWLICSLVHKFGSGNGDSTDQFIQDLQTQLPRNFRPKGTLFVFVDECHRTQSGKLHTAMKSILPNAVFIGFTVTPLLKQDKQKSIEIFGSYIHTYKFDEAVADGVVLDLRYEARDIDQRLTSQARVDQWFESKTRGLSDLAKTQLKQKWGTMQKVLSSQARLEQIVKDILMDMETKPRLMDGRGNAMLVSVPSLPATNHLPLTLKAKKAAKA